ncbi:aspartate kinase [Siccationidurans ginsengisoli]|nr:aspartate kinase [Hymenobacter sp. BT559]
MQVYKFGGASVKDAAAILNLCRIVRDFGPSGPLLIVVSAMGKTTNALEEIYDLAYHGRDYSAQLAALKAYHEQAGKEIGQALPHPGIDPSKSDAGLASLFQELSYRLANSSPSKSYDEGYDQIVSFGEALSSELVYGALAGSLDCEVYHRSTQIATDSTWREGKVDWQETEKKIRGEIQGLFSPNDDARIIVTEGFVGQVKDDHRTTTLGREGSDYSAAIFAYCLNAESVTIWKDVPGLLNADPKIFPDTVLYPEISYQETIEMAFYGASVIHPKTLKPLAERHIPLRVKSFLDPSAPGTLIHDCQHPPLVPAFIRKAGQCLLSFESKDFAFISEENLEVIFGALAQARLKINVMQNSAISFSVVVDYNEMRVQRLLGLLQGQFRVQYNSELTLFTIKNYDQASVDRLTSGRELLLEQRTRSTFQFLVRE